MKPADDYLAPAAAARGELRERGSRFLAVVAPANDEEAALATLADLAAEHRDATHHCFAWRLGPTPRERASDAGEPSGTAGVPILQVLRGRRLSDVVAVVVRWYGGTKLGKGGLARAYAAATRLAADELAIERRFARREIAVRLPYERLGAVKRLLHPPEIELVEERYGEQAELVLAVRAGRDGELTAALADLGLTASPRQR
ncbi:MAG TPA: YigZ family protein [Thermoanaerobaculia bacterium]|nr:YigZ family protein [Thermoanaerobaculia bacterium]